MAQEIVVRLIAKEMRPDRAANCQEKHLPVTAIPQPHSNLKDDILPEFKDVSFDSAAI